MFHATKLSGKGRIERTYSLKRPEYGLLPGRLPGTCGYLGGEDFMGYEDNMAYFTRKWTSDILLRDYDCVCKTLAVLLVIGGVKKNGVEAEKTSRCDRNLKSGTQCNTCGHWFHNSCGNIKAQVVESRKWIWNRCGSERFRLLEEKLHNALLQTDDLTRKNKALEEQLRLTTAGREIGRQDRVLGDCKVGKCLVLGD
jgi:hypothetical protein